MRRHFWPIITGLLAVVCLLGAVALHTAASRLTQPETATPTQAQTVIHTTRPSPAAQQTTPTAAPTSTTTQTLEASPSPTLETSTPSGPLPIEASDIVSVTIPALDIDVSSSGPTLPRESPRCKASTVCIDPPSLTEVAWYDMYARPSIPSTDSVLIYGHTNSHDDQLQAFNNLLKAQVGDFITVTTQTGSFTYEATVVTLVEYAEIAYSELVYGHIPNRVVLVTCNWQESAATVVVADLVSATPV